MALTSCAVIPTTGLNGRKGTARVTIYNKHEDRWHDRIASSSKARAKEGLTIAAEKSFAFGTRILIPLLRGIVGSGSYIVQDRGSAVEERKASRGRCPVFDVYVASRKRMKQLVRMLPEYMDYERVN